MSKVDATAVLASHTLRRADDLPRWDVDRCAHCIRPWRGDAETGGCDTVLLARRVIELEAALGRIARVTADPPVVLAQAVYTIALVHWLAELLVCGADPDPARPAPP